MRITDGAGNPAVMGVTDWLWLAVTLIGVCLFFYFFFVRRLRRAGYTWFSAIFAAAAFGIFELVSQHAR